MLRKRLVPVEIARRATAGVLSCNKAKSAGTMTENCSRDFKPTASIILPRKRHTLSSNRWTENFSNCLTFSPASACCEYLLLQRLTDGPQVGSSSIHTNRLSSHAHRQAGIHFNPLIHHLAHSLSEHPNLLETFLHSNSSTRYLCMHAAC